MSPISRKLFSIITHRASPRVSLGILITVCAFVAAVCPWQSAAMEVNPGIVAHYEQGLLTLEAKDVPLGHAVSEVARITGIRIILLGSRDARVSLPKTTDSLERVLQDLTSPANVAFIYDTDGGSDAEKVVKTVYILTSGSGHASQGPSRAPALPLENHQDSGEAKFLPGDSNRHLNVDELSFLERVLHDFEDDQLRVDAVYLLADIPDETGKAVELLAYAVRDDSLAVRLAAIEALGALAGEQALEILKASGDDPDATARLAVVDQLCSLMPDLKEVNELLLWAMQDPDPSVRQAAEQYYREMLEDLDEGD